MTEEKQERIFFDWSELPEDVREQYKRQAIFDGLTIELAKLHRQGYFLGDVSSRRAYLQLMSDPVWLAARKLNQSRYARSTRLRRRLEPLIYSGNAYWVTLTFRDAVYDSTSAKTRRDYVSRFLKSSTDYYVANIDFGDHHTYLDVDGVEKVATAREHYHAVVFGRLASKVAENGRESPDWPYGFAKQVRIRACADSLMRLPIYIAKLTNHALKESVPNIRYIYSKKVLKLDFDW